MSVNVRTEFGDEKWGGGGGSHFSEKKRRGAPAPDAIVRGAHPSKTAKGEAAESCGGAKVGQPAVIAEDAECTAGHFWTRFS